MKKHLFRKFKEVKEASNEPVVKVVSSVNGRVYELCVGNIILLLIDGNILPAVIVDSSSVIFGSGYSKTQPVMPIVCGMDASDLDNDTLDVLFPKQWVRVLTDNQCANLNKLVELEKLFCDNPTNLDNNQIQLMMDIRVELGIKQNLRDKHGTFEDMNTYIDFDL